MKHKFITYAVVPVVLGVGLVGTRAALARGLFNPPASNLSPDQIVSLQQSIFTKEAQILGISEADLKADWAQGKTFNQIIQDRKLDKTVITQRVKEQQLSQMKTQLQTLVEKNIITQAQADSRLAVMQARMEKGKGRSRGFGNFHGSRVGLSF